MIIFIQIIIERTNAITDLGKSKVISKRQGGKNKKISTQLIKVMSKFDKYLGYCVKIKSKSLNTDKTEWRCPGKPIRGFQSF